MSRIDSFKKALEFWKGELQKKDIHSKEYLEFVQAEIGRWEGRIAEEMDSQGGQAD